MVSILHWGVIFKVNHDRQNLMVGMITNGLKSPNDLYLQAKNKKMSRYGSYIYIATAV